MTTVAKLLLQPTSGRSSPRERAAHLGFDCGGSDSLHVSTACPPKVMIRGFHKKYVSSLFFVVKVLVFSVATAKLKPKKRKRF